MPVIRPGGRKEPVATLCEHLSDLLVKELIGERLRMGPVIFELPTDEPDRVDVIVVWEAWKSLKVETRSEVVRDAYGRFRKTLESSVHYIDSAKSHRPLAPAPRVITCATWEDLAGVDLLPYKIEPTAKEGEFDAEDARLLMMDVGAIWTPSGAQLRFPTKDMASGALAQLNAEMPEARWSIVESSFGPIME